MQTRQPILLADESGVETDVLTVRKAPWKALIGSAVAACALASVGYAAGQNSLRGLRVNSNTQQVLRTTDEFKHSFDSWADGLTCQKLNFWVDKIVNNGVTTDNLDATEFKEWYAGGTASVTSADKVVANGIMTASIEKACLPAVPAAPKGSAAPSSPSTCLSIQDYTTFGHCFSAATAGHPWAYILHVEEAVQGVSASAMTEEVSALHNFYKLKASDSERHLFTRNALVHMKAHGMH